MIRPRIRAVVSGAVVVLALLVVAAIGTITPTGELILSDTGQSTVAPGSGATQSELEEDQGDGEFVQEAELDETGLTVINLFWLAVFGGVVLIAVLLFAKERAEPVTDEDDEQLVHDAGHRGTLREVTSIAIDEALDGLASGMAVDDAIVECWRRLGRAAVAGGVAADHSRTSSELVEAIVGVTPARRADVAELAELYRGARYSGRATTTVEVERARACLTAIQEALR